MTYTVFSKPNCPQCDQAKALIKASGADFETVILDVGQEKQADVQYISRDELLTLFPGARMMPQVSLATADQTVKIGGLQELKTHLASLNAA